MDFLSIFFSVLMLNKTNDLNFYLIKKRSSKNALLFVYKRERKKDGGKNEIDKSKALTLFY